MKAICLLKLLALASLLSGSAHTANVPMSYAKLDVGYLDTGNYDLGWVFLWDRTERTLTSLPPLKVPDRLKDVGKTVDQQQGTLSANTDMELSADLTKTGAASGELQGRIARSTTTELDKFAREKCRPTICSTQQQGDPCVAKASSRGIPRRQLPLCLSRPRSTGKHMRARISSRDRSKAAAETH
jgi:hypothetical protein